MLGIKMFCTILHSLKSPTNVGMIIRTHVALGGRELVFVGYEHPWQFQKGSQAFSRKLESLCDIRFFQSDDELFEWIQKQGYSTVALEIAEDAIPLPQFRFPPHTALIIGSEATGLSDPFLARCDYKVMIPQFGPAECLNVAVSCSMALYELTRDSSGAREVQGAKFVRGDGQQSTAKSHAIE
jgi:tRNA G18 (ribose-2'-O)-methylase SpoU